MVIRLKVPIEMHYTVIPVGTSKVNSSPKTYLQKQTSSSYTILTTTNKRVSWFAMHDICV